MFGSNLDITTMLIRIPVLLVSLACHEFSHALVAYKLGDKSEMQRGRLTLNPLKHIDPLGLVFMILVGFGWAKPVQVDVGAFEEPKKDMALTSLAGPFANFILAFVSMLILYPVTALAFGSGGFADLAAQVLFVMVSMNLSLGVFNLIPIPPLDGSKVVAMFLPDSLYYGYMRIERFGMVILIILLFTGVMSGFLGSMIQSAFDGLWFLAEKIYFFLN